LTGTLDESIVRLEERGVTVGGVADSAQTIARITGSAKVLESNPDVESMRCDKGDIGA